MKPLRLFAFCMLLFTVISCQKEIDWGTSPTSGTGTGNGSGGSGSGGGTGGSGSTGNLLVKDTAVTGSDSLITTYTYDSQNRLETELIVGKQLGMDYKSYRKLFRDAAGRISQIKQKIDQAGFPSSDTAVTTFHYPNATANEYDYSLMNSGEFFGLVTIDSTVYTYSGSNMTTNSHYMGSYLGGSLIMPASLSQKWDFTYDASGKVTKMVNYSNTSGTPGAPLDLVGTYTYTYGTLNFQGFYTTNGAQNYAMAGLPSGNTTQVATMTIVSPTTPQVDRTVSSSYILGANGKPSKVTQTAVTVTPPATRITVHTLYYQ